MGLLKTRRKILRKKQKKFESHHKTLAKGSKEFLEKEKITATVTVTTATTTVTE